MAIAKAERANANSGKKLWQKALSEMTQNSNTKSGKAKSAKFKPNRFKRNNLVIIMVKMIVKKINKIDAIFNNVISLFYHKNWRKIEKFFVFFLAIQQVQCIIEKYA